MSDRYLNARLLKKLSIKLKCNSRQYNSPHNVIYSLFCHGFTFFVI